MLNDNFLPSFCLIWWKVAALDSPFDIPCQGMSSASHFPLVPIQTAAKPVMLPPARQDWQRIGSDRIVTPTNTIGTVRVARCQGGQRTALVGADTSGASVKSSTLPPVR